jgi:hypothetical protein
MEYVAELDRPEAVQVRAVRIAFDLGEGVMLAVHRDPFARAEPGRNPQTESKEEGDGRVKLESLVSGAAVKKNRGAENGDLRDER